MKALLLLCLAAFLAAVTSATRSPWGYVAVMKGKIRYLCDKMDALEHKVDTCCDQSSGSSCTYNGVTKQHGTFFTADDGFNWCFCYNGAYECTLATDTMSYNYRDEMAQTYCASKQEGRHVFAVRRDCGNSADPYTCDDLCGPSSVFNANLTDLLSGIAGYGDTECYDALWFWTSHPTLELNPGYLQPDAGQINMGTFSYGTGGCGWKAGHCGPNYCCCRAAAP